MSIVYEYLKQIQQQKSPGAAAVEREAGRKKKELQLPVTAIGILVLIGIIVIGVFYLGVPHRGRPDGISVYKPKGKPVPRAVSPDAGYVLEGIIYNPDRPFAIINGQMLEQDARIDDFVVASITPNTVSLKNTKDDTGRTLQL